MYSLPTHKTSIFKDRYFGGFLPQHWFFPSLWQLQRLLLIWPKCPEVLFYGSPVIKPIYRPFLPFRERGWKKILLRSTIIVGRRRIKCTQPKTRPDKQLLQTTYSSLLLPPPTLSIPDCYRWLVMHMMLSHIMLNTLSYHISNRLFGMAYLMCVINIATLYFWIQLGKT